MNDSGRPEKGPENAPEGGLGDDTPTDAALTVARIFMVLAPLALVVVVYLVLRALSG